MKDKEQYPFFVMLHHPNGGALVMVDDYDNPALFESKEDAKKAAKSSSLGFSFGYEIFELGWGEN